MMHSPVIKYLYLALCVCLFLLFSSVHHFFASSFSSSTALFLGSFSPLSHCLFDYVTKSAWACSENDEFFSAYRIRRTVCINALDHLFDINSFCCVIFFISKQSVTIQLECSDPIEQWKEWLFVWIVECIARIRIHLPLLIDWSGASRVDKTARQPHWN